METKRILGLDIGTNSIGWALIATDDSYNPIGIIKSGVRIFDAGVKGNIEEGKENSFAAARREARGRRRMLDRRKRRLKSLLKILQENRFLPAGDISSEEAQHIFFCELDLQLFQNKIDRQKNPHTLLYKLRAKALDEKLTLNELGRAIYHLAQRRGFLTNRKEGKKENDGEVNKGITELEALMESNAKRTLGEYFSTINPEAEPRTRIRERWTSRQMYTDEFEMIWERQAQYHPVLTPDLKKQIYKAIFHQRPLKSAKHLVGECQLERGKKRAPWASLISQEFRLLQKVNDLKADVGNSIRGLTEEERDKLIYELQRNGDIKFARIRTLLSLPKDTKFNLEANEDKMIGNRTASKIRKVFGSRWDEMDREKQDRIVNFIRNMDDDHIIKRAQEIWGFDEEKAKEVAEISLEDTYCLLSRAAMEKIIPKLKEGMSYRRACKELYGDVFEHAEPLISLPMLPQHRRNNRKNGGNSRSFTEKPKIHHSARQEVKHIQVTNPVVRRAITELRKVVNTIIREYGKPDTVRVELARDLKKGKKERAKISKDNNDNRRKREEAARNIFIKTGLQKDTKKDSRDIEKWLLADECGWTCPYTGKSFSWRALLSGTPQVDIEHIIPYSRSLDNSYMNKTLCYVDENRHVKREQTPFEAYGSNKDRWDEILERIKNFPEPKRRRFLIEDITEFEDFTERHLSDTRYASVLAVEYMGTLYGAQDGNDAEGKKRIFAVTGTTTSYLRNSLQLNSILNDGGQKTREDHRHHAVDAITIAITSSSILKSLAEASKKEMLKKNRVNGRIDEPWNGFINDVRDEINNLVVSHRPKRKVNAELHEGTFYSRPRKDKDTGKEYVAIRKRLESLSNKDIKEIIDDKVREKVIEKLNGDNPDKVFKTPENLPFFETKDGRKIFIKSVRIKKSNKVIPLSKGAKERHVITGSNHHVEILEQIDAKGKKRWTGEIVTTLEAMRRLKDREEIIRREHVENGKFIFSLAGGDIIEVGEEGNKRLYVIRVISNEGGGRIGYMYINDARKVSEGIERKTINKLLEANCRKVIITPLGEVRTAND